jgi:hypothetical protein
MNVPEKTEGFYDLFQRRREQLREALVAAPSAEKAAQVVETELEALLRAFWTCPQF